MKSIKKSLSVSRDVIRNLGVHSLGSVRGGSYAQGCTLSLAGGVCQTDNCGGGGTYTATNQCPSVPCVSRACGSDNCLPP